MTDILDHLIEDLGLEVVEIDKGEDFYWECYPPDLYDCSKPPKLSIGRLTDDVELSRNIQREGADAIFLNLMHVAPLLRHLAFKIGS